MLGTSPRTSQTGERTDEWALPGDADACATFAKLTAVALDARRCEASEPQLDAPSMLKPKRSLSARFHSPIGLAASHELQRAEASGTAPAPTV